MYWGVEGKLGGYETNDLTFGGGGGMRRIMTFVGVGGGTEKLQTFIIQYTFKKIECMFLAVNCNVAQ